MPRIGHAIIQQNKTYILKKCLCGKRLWLRLHTKTNMKHQFKMTNKCIYREITDQTYELCHNKKYMHLGHTPSFCYRKQPAEKTSVERLNDIQNAMGINIISYTYLETLAYKIKTMNETVNNNVYFPTSYGEGAPNIVGPPHTAPRICVSVRERPNSYIK